jgi:hypothetical protein
MSGKGNIDARGIPSILPRGTDCLHDSGEGEVIAENQEIGRKTPLLKPEILSFEYPFTFADYAAVLANPYGKIVVDGEACYIQKITPSLMKGTASFELIPVANE